MSFLPEWWSQGTNAYTPENKFGQAGMFDKPTAQQQGNFGGNLSKLISMLRRSDKNPAGANMPGSMADSNSMPQMTPYQDQQIGPNMGQVNNPYAMSPNGQIMPNWNRQYGGY